MSSFAPVDAAQLLALASDPSPRVGALTPQPWLLADAREPMPEEALERVVAWLRQLPCPSIAVAAADAQDPLSRACDVRVASVEEAAPLIANIEASPIAAAVLVQTLRVTPELPVTEALHVESLAYATLQAGPEFRRWLATRRADAPRPADAGPAVLVEREGDELRLTLNRPSNRNALSVEMRDALVEALQLAAADDSIGRVELRGAGKCFSVGGDLAEFGTLPDPASAHAVRALTMPGRYLAACADRAVCRVHGACIGSGVELPAFASRVVAAEDAFFHLPELKYGLIPGGGGCVSIPRRIGRQRTAWLALSGKRINARRALEWGLVDAIEGG